MRKFLAKRCISRFDAIAACGITLIIVQAGLPWWATFFLAFPVAAVSRWLERTP